MTSITKGLFSSETCEWATPQSLFDTLDAEFGFTLDVCATRENAKCTNYYTETEDGLKQEWKGVCWMNPPYGREISKWVKKAKETAERGGGDVVVCLVPARTDTKWWQEQAMHASEIRLIAGRVKFSGHKSGAPFPSAVLIFGTPKCPVVRRVVYE